MNTPHVENTTGKNFGLLKFQQLIDARAVGNFSALSEKRFNVKRFKDFRGAASIVAWLLLCCSSSAPSVLIRDAATLFPFALEFPL
jgi:hypothetical protein